MIGGESSLVGAVGPRRPWWVVACLLFVILATSMIGRAADDPVSSTREALKETPDLPWYDSESDELRPAVPPPVDPPPEISARSWRVPERKDWNVSAGTSDFWSHLLEVLAWIVVALILAGLTYVFVMMILRNDSGDGVVAGVEFEDEPIHEDRIENLPFQVASGRGDFLGDARRLADAGQYGQAIVYLYSYKLLQLDRHQHIRLAKGKTNRQYLRELKSYPALGQILTRTMIAFEDFFFGNHRIDRDRFEICWSQLDEFRTLIQQDQQLAVR